MERSVELGSLVTRILPPVSGVPETHYARSGNVDVAYQVAQGDGPDILLVSYPAIPIDLMWDDPLLARGLRRLTDAARLLACDLRGWGSSGPIHGQVPALQAWMDDIASVMDASGSEKASVVAMGALGAPAMLFAAAHPERVSSLVLVDSHARYERADDYPIGMPDNTLRRAVEWYSASLGRGPIGDLMAPSRAADPLFRQWLLRAERLSMGPGDPERTATVDRFMRADVRSVLPAIRAPCLVIHRTGDRFVRVAHSHYLAERVPTAQLIELPGADHLWCSGDVDGLFEQIAAFISGTPERRLPGDRVLATIVFTDIVGSTEIARSLGDRVWRATLERYEEIAARHVESFRGRLVKSTGDGTLALFDGPARAIDCACAIRDAVGSLRLRIRAGVHTGEIEMMGNDIGGIAVHIGARVTALAAADQVLVSAAVPPLVIGSGVQFEDRGIHSLRGVSDPWRLFAATI